MYFMIMVSEKAVQKIREVLNQEHKEDWAIRIGVKGGGCSGFTYALKIDQQAGENDQVFEFDGVRVLVDSKSFVYLAGAELDYMDGLNGSGFVFNNPNAERTCGCGNSFGA
jgi:iron-sulfur cluster assembly protein